MSDEHFQLLRTMPVFAGLNNDSLQLILDDSEVVEVAAGDYFFREGDGAKSLFVLQQGVVAIERLWKGAPVVLGEFGRGDCIGEMALIDMMPRSASVRAVEDCQAIEVTLSSLRKLLQRNLEQYAIIMMNMGREVSRRLRAADDRLFSLEQMVPDPRS